MKVGRYVGSGVVRITDEPIPACPQGGLLVKAEACGLCSGELMEWYMDRKIPHVLGHEVAGTVIETQDPRFSVGAKVFPHHHAPCLECPECKKGRFVHCEQWKRTKLDPGGMAEYFGVSAENLSDTIAVGELRAIDAAIIEPVACVHKSLRLGNMQPDSRTAVIGLGTMGLIHALLIPGSIGFEINPNRIDWAQNLGINSVEPDDWDGQGFDRIFVCPGSQVAFDLALKMANPECTIVMFAPLPPNEDLKIDHSAYFKDVAIVNSYSCGPDDARRAFESVASGRVRAEMVASDFIGIDQLPRSYKDMKEGRILKSIVVFE
jgi:L-iditol 2-dehydrogenase